jgi:Hemerythrin HHE cation binding domain
MLFSIRKGAPSSLETPTRALDLLLACHTRIRGFARLASDLVALPNAPPADIAEAARALVRYHRFALPLHEADEDLSLRPRLDAICLPERIREELAAMTEGHRRIDVIVAELILGWSALVDAPEQIMRLSHTLTPLTVTLLRLWDPHLTSEETVVFSALALLPPESERSLFNEMRARRAASIEGLDGAAIPSAVVVPEAH